MLSLALPRWSKSWLLLVAMALNLLRATTSKSQNALDDGLKNTLALLEVSDSTNEYNVGCDKEKLGIFASSIPQDVWVVGVLDSNFTAATSSGAARKGSSYKEYKRPATTQWARTYRTRHPEAVLTLLLDSGAVLSASEHRGGSTESIGSGGGRVTYSDVRSTAQASPDFTAVRGGLELTAEASQAAALTARIRSNGLALWLDRPRKINSGSNSSSTGSDAECFHSSVLDVPKAGTLNYRHGEASRGLGRLEDTVELTQCRGRVGAYAGAFLVGVDLFLAADYGPSMQVLSSHEGAAASAGHAPFPRKRQGFRGDSGLGWRMLEGATFRVLAALESSNTGLVVKTSDPLDFYVNHFSGWAHWHRRHSASQTTSSYDDASHENGASIPEDSRRRTESGGGEITDVPEGNYAIRELSNMTNAGHFVTKNGSGKLLSALDVHLKRSKELSRLMDLECRNLMAGSSVVDKAMALVPFWGRSAESSGGNAHFNAVDRTAALQIASGAVCSALRYFGKAVVGTCGKSDAASLARRLRHRWQICAHVLPAAAVLGSLTHVGDDTDTSSDGHRSNNEDYDFDALRDFTDNECSEPGVWVLAFECARGVHLPFHLLTAAQAILTDSTTPSSTSTAPTSAIPFSANASPEASLLSAFAHTNLLYYTEADQVTIARSPRSLRNLAAVARSRDSLAVDSTLDASAAKKYSPSRARHKASGHSGARSVLIAPQRVTMRFPESAFTALEEISDYHQSKSIASSELIGEERYEVSKAGPSLTEAVEVVARSLSSLDDLKKNEPRLAKALTLSNACVTCPAALCHTHQADTDSAVDGADTSASSISSMSASATEARRHWLLSHGFDPRDTRIWPSQKPSHTPTLVPLSMPTLMPTLVPSPLPSYVPIPQPSRPPGPQHPLVHISRALAVLAVCLAAAAKIKLLRSDHNLFTRESPKNNTASISTAKKLLGNWSYVTDKAHSASERTPKTGSSADMTAGGTIKASSPTDSNYVSHKKDDKAWIGNNRERRLRSVSRDNQSHGTKGINQTGQSRERKLLRAAAAKALARSACEFIPVDNNKYINGRNDDDFTSV